MSMSPFNILYFKITIKIKDAGIVFKDILNLLRLIERYIWFTIVLIQYYNTMYHSVPMIFSLFHCH